MIHRNKNLLVILSVILAVVVTVLWTRKSQRYDKFILEKVSTELALDETLRDTEVSAERGVVFLTGSVKRLEDARQAVRKASNVEHVRGVTSRIVIDSGRVPDLRLRLQLEQLVREQQLWEIEIGVRKGTVTLRGPVRGEAERELVLTQVSRTEGVRAVDDRLTVVE